MSIAARGASLWFCALFAALGSLLMPARAAAADPKPAETALSKVPADAEYFSSTLRLGETIETIGKSRLWQQSWNDPAVQDLVKKARESFAGEGFEPLRKFFADPANAELPALALDAFSNEIFVYTGAGTGDLLALLQELAGGARYGPAFQQLLGQGAGGDPTRARARIILQSLSEKPERVRIPDLVIGFKVSDPAKVNAQLKRLDPLVADALKDSPLKGRSKRVKIGDDEFLTLNLDGSLVPWDQVPLAMFEDKEGEFAPLMKHLKAMKLTIALGVHEGYLLLAIGHSTDAIAKFGGAGPKLAGVPALKPVTDASGKPITSISYISAKLRQATATTAEDVAAYNEVARAVLEKAEIPADLEKAVMKDVESLTAAIARGLVKPGAVASYSFRTPRGWQTLAYDYTPTAGPAETRPLTLLNHLGGAPLLAAVWRSGTTVDDYRTFVKWATAIGGHAQKFAEAKFPDAAPTIEMVRKEILPLIQELSDVTETLWLPALADGQEGFVIDAKWTSKKWHESFETDRPLPLPEFGIVLGVSDRSKLERALEGYHATANKLITKVRELAPPGQVPEFAIPKPKIEKKDGRTFAWYPIPAEWGLDKQFQPTGGLSDSVAALTLSRSHTELLLTPTTLTAGLAPFADSKKPLDSAFYINWGGFVEAATPWVGYFISKAELGDNREQSLKISQRVINILKVFRAYGSVTYREGGATVTHSEAAFEDVPALPPGK